MLVEGRRIVKATPERRWALTSAKFICWSCEDDLTQDIPERLREARVAEAGESFNKAVTVTCRNHHENRFAFQTSSASLEPDEMVDSSEHWIWVVRGTLPQSLPLAEGAGERRVPLELGRLVTRELISGSNMASTREAVATSRTAANIVRDALQDSLKGAGRDGW
jgi:hypothetical protein